MAKIKLRMRAIGTTSKRIRVIDIEKITCGWLSDHSAFENAPR